MASIPLLCNICPKHPDFSDISHLLTHVGSKGHLSHYFKAQVRSRQDATVRQQLEAYDRWYAKHQIEKLLSQRMVLKESKDTKAKPRAMRKNLLPPAVSSNAPKKSSKTRAALRESSLTAKAEDFIDPQLSQAYYPSKESPSGNLPPLVSDGHSYKLASEHRAHIPTMQQRSIFRKDSFETPKKSKLSLSQFENGIDSESNSDQDDLSFRSPVPKSYPDPTALQDHVSIQLSDLSSPHSKENLHDQYAENTVGEKVSAVFDVGLTQSPKLKGTHYPGMSIFDSASLEAQRKRNQKKNTSIMAQMELNSVGVEPLERIYWPEGNLKKERIITGMVESSPMKEDSPKPKRQRQVPKRVPLDNLSINKPREVRRRRGRKPTSRVEIPHDANLDDLTKRAVGTLDFSLVDLGINYTGLKTVGEEKNDWKLNADSPNYGSNHEFIVFDDESDEQLGCFPQSHGLESLYRSDSNAYSNADDLTSKILSSHNLGLSFTPPEQHLSSQANLYSASSSLRIPAMDRVYRSSVDPRSISMKNKENIEPHIDCRSRIDNAAMHIGAEHSTQRYFSVSGSHPPEFFDFLPPHMDFGGLANSRFSGSSLNPLNANVQRQKNQNLQSQNVNISSAGLRRGRTPPRA